MSTAAVHRTSATAGVGWAVFLWVAAGVGYRYSYQASIQAADRTALTSHLWLLPLYLLAGYLLWWGDRGAPREQARFILRRGVVGFGLPFWLIVKPAKELAKAGYTLSALDVGASTCAMAILQIALSGILMGKFLWSRRALPAVSPGAGTPQGAG